MQFINEQQWQNDIEKLEQETKPTTKEQLKETILTAIKKNVPQEKFGVFLSGGVDSSFIAMLCKQQNADFICYSVGLKGAPDIDAAKKVAQQFGLQHRIKEYSIEEAEELFKKTIKLLNNTNVVTIGVASVVYAAVELAKKDNITKLFSGIGSEEIFAGYDRHLKATDKHAECWRGLKAMWQRDLVRDIILMKKLGFQALAPFLDNDVIKIAMGIDISRKINNEHKKIILREIAEECGLMQDIAWRDKKAAQYGSWLDKAMEKLAKKNKFETKGEYLKSLV
ncbi:asparagine synthetase B [Candidatus Woesearchaeota archaeon]|nr:asparagine synthetase B [Candidatus Woesearchaeota archaeon]